MDNLSIFLGLAQTQVNIDVRCQLAQSFLVAHSDLPKGQAAFHLSLNGECEITPYGAGTIRMQDGDFVLLTKGQGHLVTDALDILERQNTPRPPITSRDTPAYSLKSNISCEAASCTNGCDAAQLDMVCGRFIYPSQAQTIMLEGLPPVLHVNLKSSAQMQALLALIELLKIESRQTDAGAKAIVNALGQTLLIMALRTFAAENPNATGALALACDARIGQSIQAMVREPGRNWQIETLGSLCAMSRATYARQFKARAGITVGEFLQKVRVLHACNLMHSTNYSIAEIAQLAGYQSEAAFSKAFKQIMEKAPGRWRKEQPQSPAQVK